MTSLVVFNKAIREKMAVALYTVAPSIKSSLQGSELRLNVEQRQKIMDCIQAVKNAASLRLNLAIARIEKDLGNGTLATGIGRTIK
jgi:hypothetical protein